MSPSSDTRSYTQTTLQIRGKTALLVPPSPSSARSLRTRSPSPDSRRALQLPTEESAESEPENEASDSALTASVPQSPAPSHLKKRIPKGANRTVGHGKRKSSASRNFSNSSQT
ncbi:hypothetical protein DFH28DRAFT_935505 [Melampsora americana]|nr:hypothetical protein DFH28DRAFT_935505 [Melampsora americana]